MKKMLLTFVAILSILPFIADAQWNPVTGGIYYNSGNVGIGTISPSGKLTVKNNGTSLEFDTDLSSSAILSYDRTNNIYKKMIIRGSSFGFYPSDVEKVTIDGNGNVGVGTTSPQEALDVNGNPVFGVGLERLSMGSGSLAFNRKVSNGVIYNGAASAYQFQHTGNNSSTNDYLALQVYNPSGSQVTPVALTINGAAQIGINTSYIPSGYQFAINGSAIATSVTVQLRNAWPDYVFNPTYNLATLKEVKTYIDQNHHLPEIPSEEEVKKDGINLGEMNKLLVKKVEELTLYLIQEHDDKKKQQTEIDQLKQQLETLTKEVHSN